MQVPRFSRANNLPEVEIVTNMKQLLFNIKVPFCLRENLEELVRNPGTWIEVNYIKAEFERFLKQ